MDLFSTAVEHGLISVVGWLIGVVLGGGMGYGCALLMRAVFSSLPRLHKLSALLPWRTVVLGTLLIACSPAVVVPFGLGPTAGLVSVGLAILLLALPFTANVLLEYWNPSLVVVRLIAGARTLATAAVVFTAGIGLFGGGGLGLIAVQSMRLLDYDTAVDACLIVISLMLALDLLLGALQVIASYMFGRTQQTVPVREQNTG